MTIMYKKRPKDGSRLAWDYITRVYGEIKMMQFDPACCGVHHWTAQVGEKIIMVDEEEIKGERWNI